MISTAAEAELRAITSLARGCEKSHGKKQTAMLFGLLADRLDSFIEQHGDSAWRGRIMRRGTDDGGP